jgi:hypothetical protein
MSSEIDTGCRKRWSPRRRKKPWMQKAKPPDAARRTAMTWPAVDQETETCQHGEDEGVEHQVQLVAARYVKQLPLLPARRIDRCVISSAAFRP